MEFSGYAATQPKSELSTHQYQADLGDHDVAIDITHCGICHSDISLIDDEWQMSSYPFIPGHEIVGKVARIGDHVTNVAVGDRVGVGWQCSSCHDCEWCISGQQQNCSDQQATCVGRNGGYANGIIVDSQFAIPIPKSLDSALAAPMMCGGITVFTPIHTYVRPHHTVAVVGLGGLGHFAVMFAAAMGAQVHVLSTSPKKANEAETLGAEKLINVKEEKFFETYQNTYDVIINTAPASLHWEGYVSLLRPNGTFVQVGAAPENMSVSAFGLIGADKKIVGSHIGSPALIAKMLSFAASNNLSSVIETFPLSKVNVALERARGKPRFRVVLECQ